jgi:hypothetical protein
MRHGHAITAALALALAGSMAAQGLGEAAAREKKRREAKATAGKDKDKPAGSAFTDQDLQKYSGQRPNGETTESEAPDAAPPSEPGSDPVIVRTSVPTPPVNEAAKRRQLEAIDGRIRDCKVRLTAAQEAIKAAEQATPSVEITNGGYDHREEVNRLKATGIAKARAKAEQIQGECTLMEDEERRMRR